MELNFIAEAANVVLVATGNIGAPGAGNGLEIAGDNLAAQTGGSSYISDVTGNLTIANLTAASFGNVVNGVNAGVDTCVETVGTLTVNSNVTAVNNAAVQGASVVFAIGNVSAGNNAGVLSVEEK